MSTQQRGSLGLGWRTGGGAGFLTALLPPSASCPAGWCHWAQEWGKIQANIPLMKTTRRRVLSFHTQLSSFQGLVPCKLSLFLLETWTASLFYELLKFLRVNRDQKNVVQEHVLSISLMSPYRCECPAHNEY